jgi:hypothetical protein
MGVLEIFDSMGDVIRDFWWIIAIVVGIIMLALFIYFGMIEWKIYVTPMINSAKNSSIHICPVCNCTGV